MLRCISKILGKEDDSTIDKSVLGMFSLLMKPKVVLDIPSYWQEFVNTQCMSLSLVAKIHPLTWVGSTWPRVVPFFA